MHPNQIKSHWKKTDSTWWFVFQIVFESKKAPELNQNKNHYKIRTWVVVSNIVYFHPNLGKIPILTNISQMGWNHQQGTYS